MNHHCHCSLPSIMLWQRVSLDLLPLGWIKGPVCDFFMKYPLKSPTISGLMMHILMIMTIIRALLIFLSRLLAWLDDSKDSISYPLLNYHLDFFVNKWNGRKLLLFCTIIPLAFYPCCWFFAGEGKSLRRASFFCSRLVNNRWLNR